MFHNPLCHAVEVAVSKRSKVGRVRVSDGVETVGNCRDRVGILVEHAVNSGQHARLCVPRDLDDPWPFFRSVRTGSNLSSRTQSSSFSRSNLSLRMNSPSGRAARSWVALSSVILAFRANLPALACMPSAISMSPMSSGSSPSTLQVEKTAEVPSNSNVNLDPLVGRKPH